MFCLLPLPITILILNSEETHTGCHKGLWWVDLGWPPNAHQITLSLLSHQQTGEKIRWKDHGSRLGHGGYSAVTIMGKSDTTWGNV